MHELSALLTDRLRPLYEAVNAKATVVLTPGDGKEGWGQQLKDGKCFITTNKARNPEAAFGHELLHGDDETNGFVIPPFLDGHDSGGHVEGILAFAHNALVHHRIFPRYTALGLPAERFLNDRDKKEVQRVYGDVFELKAKKLSGVKGAVVALPFLSLSSPDDASDRTVRTREILRQLAEPETWALLEALVRSVRAEQSSGNWKYWLAAYFALAGYERVAFESIGSADNQIVSGNLRLSISSDLLEVEDLANSVRVRAQ